MSGFKDQPEIIGISETKLRESNLNRNIDLKGYNFVHSDSKTFAGGMGIYIKNTLNYSVNKCSKNVLLNTEYRWVDIITNKNPVTIGVVCRHLDDSTAGIDRFTDELNELFPRLNNNKSEFYCVFNFNINLMNVL